ncbi:MAG: hypothetical protein FWG89_05970 [Treponema sp.]|nr:hypothetical protein [Treponema sp.]
MTRNKSLLFRSLLFFAGVGIIILAFFLTKGDRELTGVDAFIWTSIGVMYLVLALPFFFSAISVGNFSEKIPSLVIIWWRSIPLYIVASIIIIILLSWNPPVIIINTAIIIQSILLFLFALSIYLSFFASSHVRRVATEEAGKQQYISQLKPKAQSLLLSVNKLPAEYEKTQQILKQAIEEIRYIYPVDGGAGNDLELKIIKSLNILSEYCGGIQGGAHTSALENEADNLRMLVKERKLLRN